MAFFYSNFIIFSQLTFSFSCRIISDKERPFPQQLNFYQDRGAISRSTAAESLNRLRRCRKGAVAEVCRMVEYRHAGHVGKYLTGCHGKHLPWSASFVPEGPCPPEVRLFPKKARLCRRRPGPHTPAGRRRGPRDPQGAGRRQVPQISRSILLKGGRFP